MADCIQNCNITPCKVDTLMVYKDGHEYILAPNYANPQPDEQNPGNRYQIISSWETDKAATVKFLSGTKCPVEGAQPRLQVMGPGGKVETLPPGQATYKALCPKPPKELEDSEIPFWFFIKELLFPWKATAAEYDVGTHCCAVHSKLRAIIEAFPQMEWKGELQIELGARSSTPTGSDDKTDCRPEVKVVKKNLMVKYGNKEYRLSGDRGGR